MNEKKIYNGLFINELQLDIATSLLKSSIPTVVTVTDIPITLPADKVNVEDFQAGFNDGGNDFKDLSF